MGDKANSEVVKAFNAKVNERKALADKITDNTSPGDKQKIQAKLVDIDTAIARCRNQIQNYDLQTEVFAKSKVRVTQFKDKQNILQKLSVYASGIPMGRNILRHLKKET